MADPYQGEHTPSLKEFPPELLLLIFDEIADSDLASLMRASATFVPCAAEIVRSRLQEKGVIDEFLGATRLFLREDFDDTLIFLLCESLHLQKVLVDFDFWTLLNVAPRVYRVIRGLERLSGVRIRLHMAEINLLRDSRCVSALDGVWEAVDNRILEKIELRCDERDPPPRSTGTSVNGSSATPPSFSKRQIRVLIPLKSTQCLPRNNGALDSAALG
ncbi:hypothetical protein NP233_g12226 [Leucocoprinus birnbaumii]|uniref:F-box domain-containing protein n=1 Tax=Leucocoprinus birnbaumii TaxID=56174 RepID=A0AAD5VKJ0_9AGAR|nr:hypothetical protein NP233_g12226 [Leucocoprinus birnbaumii]